MSPGEYHHGALVASTAGFGGATLSLLAPERARKLTFFLSQRLGINRSSFNLCMTKPLLKQIKRDALLHGLNTKGMA